MQAATALAEVLQDQHRLGWVAIYMTSCFYNMGQPDHAIETGQHALAMAQSLGDVALEVQAAYYLGLAYHLLGDLRQAVEALGRNVTFLEGRLVWERFGLPYLPSVFSRTWLVWCLAELGSFAEAIAHGGEAVRTAEAIDAQAEVLLTLAMAHGFPFWAGFGTYWRGWTLAMQGQGMPAVLAAGQELGWPFCLVILAEAPGHAHQVDEGLRLLAEALTAFEESGRGDMLAGAYRLRGELLLRRATPDGAQAEARFQQALAIARVR